MKKNYIIFYFKINFRTVAHGVLNFLFAYVFLPLIGFAVSFMIAFPKEEAFQHVPSAFIKVLLNH